MSDIIDVLRAINDFLNENIVKLGPYASVCYGLRDTNGLNDTICGLVACTQDHEFLITYQESTGNIKIKTSNRNSFTSPPYADTFIPLSQPDSFEQVLLLMTEPHRLDRHINHIFGHDHIFSIPGHDYEFGPGNSR